MIYRNPFQEKLKQLDQELKKNMIGLKPHHSSGDWDFTNAGWELNAIVYVSAPSSLKFKTPPTSFNTTKVKITTVPIANVKEGRIIIQLQSEVEAVARTIRIAFRYQDDDNYYFVKLVCSSINVGQTVYRRKVGAETILRSVLQSFRKDIWKQFRITWWNDYVGLVIRVEHWTGSEWATWIPDAYDSENNWKDIGGRIGMGDFGRSETVVNWYIDDTEIYGIS